MCPAVWPGCLDESSAGRNAPIALGSRTLLGFVFSFFSQA